MKASTKGEPKDSLPVHADHSKFEPLALSIEDTRAALGGMSRQSIYNLINAGKLETAKVGTRRLVLLDSVRAFLGSCIDLKKAA